MEPRIQYAKTKDGVSIAYSTLGEGGMPFVQMPFPFAHLQLNWEIPEYRSWYERLAKKWRLVRYDARGTGLSDRDVTDFSLDAGVLDLGTAVNLAARICGHAEAGQILAPIVVRELTAGKQFLFADLGETELRGFEDPVRLYELRWREEG